MDEVRDRGRAAALLEILKEVSPESFIQADRDYRECIIDGTFDLCEVVRRLERASHS